MTDKPIFEPRKTTRTLETLGSSSPESPPRARRGSAVRRVARLAVVAVICAGLAGVSAALAASLQARSASPPITWERCTTAEFRGLDCGKVSVPVDWSDATGEKVTLALVRRRADDRERRIGTLMLNNGGGSSTIEQLRLGLGVGAFHDTLTSRFDLVALDPRGVGQSSPVRCGRPQRSPGVSYFPRDREAFRALVADNEALYAACRRLNGPLLEHLDLESLARDFDAVRAALGEEQVTWYGILGSTLLGRTYTRMFPERVRAMVFDTALDDSVPPVQALAGEARAAETAFDRFIAWCDTTPECTLQGQDIRARFQELVAEADRTPLPVRGGQALAGEDVRAAVQEHLVTRFAWPLFAEALQAALAGDATALATSPDGTYNPLQDHVTNCATTAPAAKTLLELEQLGRMVRELSPQLGGATRAWKTAAGCIGWPNRPVAPPAVTAVPAAPPTLILQSTHQSLSPYTSGFSLARQLPGSVVLTREGDDYSTIIWSPSASAQRLTPFSSAANCRSRARPAPTDGVIPPFTPPTLAKSVR